MIVGNNIGPVTALSITAGAYSANDVVGGLIQFKTTTSEGVIMIRNVLLVDDDNEKADLKLYLFNDAPTSIADNGAFTLSAADQLKLAGKVTIAAADYETVGSDAYALKAGVNVSVPVPNGSIWAYLVCTATPTYTATTDLRIRLHVVEDGR